MKTQYRILIILSAIIFVIFQSCNKSSSSIKENDISKSQEIGLMKNMSVGTMGLKDTINNIRGRIVYPLNVEKDEDNLNLEPAVQFIIDDLRNFTKKIKAMDTMNRQDTNYYFHTVKNIYEYDGIISVLYEKQSHLSGTKDTLREILSYNYDEETSKPLTFTDVFKVNTSNLKEFNSLFKTNLTMQDLQNLSFNFEKDKIWLNIVSIGKATERRSAELKKVKKFLIDD